MREEGVVAIYLPIGPLKTRSGLEPVPRYEPNTQFCKNTLQMFTTAINRTVHSQMKD